jgi:hypothetical protein
MYNIQAENMDTLSTNADTHSPSYYTFRHARNVMEMVAILHRQGIFGLRTRAGMAPSGCYWRVKIFTTTDDETHLYPSAKADSARYSSGQENHYFGWEDTENDSLYDLAKKFRERFPLLTQQAWCARNFDILRRRENYTKWFAAMLEQTAPLGLVWEYADYPYDFLTSLPVMMFEGEQVRVPLPPF